MAKPFSIIAFAAFAAMLTSCFKDEAPNSECDIEQAYIHAEVPADMFLHPTDSLVNVTSADTKVSMFVLDGTDLTRLAPRFRITEGATIQPANGSEQDFSNGPVTYTVTSEDGAYHRTYEVSIGYYPNSISEFNFENCYLEKNRNKYYVWSDYGEDVEANWTTGNSGYALARGSAKPEDYPSTPLEEGYEGKGVKLVTRDTGPIAAMVKIYIAAGNLFTGKFDGQAAMKSQDGALKSTHFGEGSYNKIFKRPVSFSGYYQYTPGENFQDEKKNVIEGRVDAGDMYAVVFKNTINNESFYLTGDNVLSSPQIVAVARVPKVERTEGGWQRFSVNFTSDLGFEHITDYDPQLLKNGGYSMSVVFTSSKEGASFRGAVGSTLLIDKVRVVYEE